MITYVSIELGRLFGTFYGAKMDTTENQS